MVLLAVPQQSVLGAILFNIFTNNIYFVDGILICDYAGDGLLCSIQNNW